MCSGSNKKYPTQTGLRQQKALSGRPNAAQCFWGWHCWCLLYNIPCFKIFSVFLLKSVKMSVKMLKGLRIYINLESLGSYFKCTLFCWMNFQGLQMCTHPSPESGALNCHESWNFIAPLFSLKERWGCHKLPWEIRNFLLFQLMLKIVSIWRGILWRAFLLHMLN